MVLPGRWQATVSQDCLMPPSLSRCELPWSWPRQGSSGHPAMPGEDWGISGTRPLSLHCQGSLWTARGDLSQPPTYSGL